MERLHASGGWADVSSVKRPAELAPCLDIIPMYSIHEPNNRQHTAPCTEMLHCRLVCLSVRNFSQKVADWFLWQVCKAVVLGTVNLILKWPQLWFGAPFSIFLPWTEPKLYGRYYEDKFWYHLVYSITARRVLSDWQNCDDLQRTLDAKDCAKRAQPALKSSWLLKRELSSPQLHHITTRTGCPLP